MSSQKERKGPTHFMPGMAGRPPKGAVASVGPNRCKWKHGDEINLYPYDLGFEGNRNPAGTLGFSHCKQCYIPLLPGIPGVREERPAFRRQTERGCAGCKVNLCSWACMLAWDHQNQCQRREVVLLLQYAQSHRLRQWGGWGLLQSQCQWSLRRPERGRRDAGDHLAMSRPWSSPRRSPTVEGHGGTRGGRTTPRELDSEQYTIGKQISYSFRICFQKIKDVKRLRAKFSEA